MAAQRYPDAPERQDAYLAAAAQALRAVLRDIEVGEPLAEVPPRSYGSGVGTNSIPHRAASG